jgi:hypothetical protein
MASILGLSLGLGIPIVVFLLVCVCCSTYNFRKERQKIQKRDHEIKIEKQRYKEAQVRWDESAKAKLIQKAEKVETVKTVPNLYDPQYAPRLNQLPRNWEQFMNTGSYVMRVAQILDTKTIPYEVWDWLMFKDQEFYEYLKKQDNPVSNILKHLLECEAKHHNKSLHEVYMNTYIPMCTKLDRSYPLPIDTHMPAVL